MNKISKRRPGRNIVPIIAVLFVSLFLWLSATPLLMWFEHYEFEQELRDAEARWQRSGVANYSFVFRNSSMHAPTSSELRIEIRNSSFFAAHDADTGHAIPDSQLSQMPLTIEAIFDDAERLLAMRPARFDARYHSVLGYPISINAYFSDSTHDEVDYAIRQLEVANNGL